MSEPPSIPTLKAAPATLEYHNAVPDDRQPSEWRQMLIGFGAWAAGVVVLVVLMSFAAQSENPLPVFLAAAMPVVGEIVVGIYFALRRGWVFFIVGQLIGMALSCTLTIAGATLA